MYTYRESPFCMHEQVANSFEQVGRIPGAEQGSTINKERFTGEWIALSLVVQVILLPGDLFGY